MTVSSAFHHRQDHAEGRQPRREVPGAVDRVDDEGKLGARQSVEQGRIGRHGLFPRISAPGKSFARAREIASSAARSASVTRSSGAVLVRTSSGRSRESAA
jgi:hypothetical protein